MSQFKPKITKIIWNDYWTFLGALLPLVSAAMLLFLTIFNFLPATQGHDRISADSSSVKFFTIFFGLSLLFGGAIIMWRIKKIARLFSIGEEVQGKIQEIYFYRDRGKIMYSYFYGNTLYLAGMGVHKNKKTLRFRLGQEVTLLVNNRNFKETILKDVFT